MTDRRLTFQRADSDPPASPVDHGHRTSLNVFEQASSQRPIPIAPDPQHNLPGPRPFLPSLHRQSTLMLFKNESGSQVLLPDSYPGPTLDQHQETAKPLPHVHQAAPVRDPNPDHNQDPLTGFASSVHLPARVEPFPHLAPTTHSGFISHIRRPILPAIHLLLIITHLILIVLIPYLLVKYIIQPLVLWLILGVMVVMSALYFLPGICLELVGLVRGRPVGSCWLQSGLHLTFIFISLIPAALTIFLLIKSDQTPLCSSPWFYKRPEYPNFIAYRPGSACEGLPKVLVMAMVDTVLLLLEITITSMAIGWDYRLRRRKVAKAQKLFKFQGEKSEKQSRRATLVLDVMNEQGNQEPGQSGHGMEMKVDNAASVTAAMKVEARWQTGVGTLLWEIESDMVNRYHRHTA